MEPEGYTFRGKVTCYYQEAGPFGGNRAVFTGPVTKETPGFNTGGFAVLVSDGAGNLGSDAFNVFGGAAMDSNCAQNFGFSIFDRFPPPRSLYYVTTGDIVVR